MAEEKNSPVSRRETDSQNLSQDCLAQFAIQSLILLLLPGAKVEEATSAYVDMLKNRHEKASSLFMTDV